MHEIKIGKSKRSLLIRLGVVLLMLLMYNVIWSQRISSTKSKWEPWLSYEDFLHNCNLSSSEDTYGLKEVDANIIHIALAHCLVKDERRIQDAVNLIKSALYMTPKGKIHFHVITDNSGPILKQISAWPISEKRYEITFYPPCFAEKNLYFAFKPCAVQRLFIPHIIQGVPLVLYVDTDVVFLGPVHDVWAHFNNFTSQQVIGMAPESMLTDSWYDGINPGRTMLHPGPHGYNAGVILWNLTKSRNKEWYNTMRQISEKQANTRQAYDFLSLYDQDYLNEYFYTNPTKLYTLPCSHNYRSDFCESYQDTGHHTCQDAETHGVTVLHANRELFHKDHHVFSDIHNIFTQLEVDTPITNMFTQIKTQLSNRAKPECPREVFYKKLQNISTKS